MVKCSVILAKQQQAIFKKVLNEKKHAEVRQICNAM